MTRMMRIEFKVNNTDRLCQMLSLVLKLMSTIADYFGAS